MVGDRDEPVSAEKPSAISATVPVAVRRESEGKARPARPPEGRSAKAAPQGPGSTEAPTSDTPELPESDVADEAAAAGSRAEPPRPPDRAEAGAPDGGRGLSAVDAALADDAAPEDAVADVLVGDPSIADDTAAGVAPATPRRRHDARGFRLAVAVAAIVILSGLWRLVIMVQWSWVQDDWAYVIGAHETPFWPYVTQDYTGHLMPAQFAFMWVITHLAPLVYGWAVAGVWTLGVASLVVWALLFRRLLGQRWAAVVPLVPLALAAGWVPIVLWVAAGLQAMSLQLFLGLTLLASLRWIERGKRSGLALTVLAFLGGLLFWEKAVLIPIAVVGLGLLLARDPSGRLYRSRLAALVVALAVPALGYAAIYRAVVPTNEASRVGVARSLPDALAFYWSAFVNHLLPSALGGPWHEPLTPSTAAAAPSTWAQWLVIALSVAVVLWALGRRRRGWIPVVTLLAYSVASMGLVLTSSRYDYLGGIAVLDSRYGADTLAVLLLMGTLLLVPAASERGVLDRRPPTTRLPSWAMPVTACVLVASCLYSSSTIWDSFSVNSPRPWVDALTSDAQRVGAASIFDSRAPANVLPAIMFPKDSHISRMLSPLELPVRWNAPTNKMLTADANGHLMVASFSDALHAVRGPVRGCGYLLLPGKPVQVPLSGAAFDWEWGLVVGGYSARGGTILVRADHRELDIPFGTGLTETQAVLGDSARSLTLTATPASGPICVTSVTLGLITPSGQAA